MKAKNVEQLTKRNLRDYVSISKCKANILLEVLDKGYQYIFDPMMSSNNSYFSISF